MKLFEGRGLSTGVQWELARLVSNGRLDSYDKLDISLLDKLKGTNLEAAPKVIQLIRPDLHKEDVSQFSKAFAAELAHRVSGEALIAVLFIDNIVIVSVART